MTVNATATKRGSVGRPDGYDVFISYRSEKSARHALAIRDALDRLSRLAGGDDPIRIFLDRTSLRAGSLAGNIEAAIRNSRYLLVLVDETTHTSKWVDQEIEQWFSEGGGSPERLFLIRTSKLVDLTWDAGREDFRIPLGLPAPLRGRFENEQKYIEMADAPRRISEVDLFSLVPLYSAVMDTDYEALNMDVQRFQVRQKRRTRIFTAALASALVVAIVLGIVAAASAVRADAAARQATADAQAAEALLAVPVSPDKAIDLAISASKLSDSSSVRSALLAVASDTGRLERTLSLATDGGARLLTGVRQTAKGDHVSAWGPTQDGAQTVVSTWTTTNGSLLHSFVVPFAGVKDVAEVPGKGYLMCTADGAVYIDGSAGAAEVLRDKLDACSAASLSFGAVLETFSEGQAWMRVVGITNSGARFDVPGKLAPGLPSAGIRAVVEEATGVTQLLTGAGVLEVPADARGRYVQTVAGEVVTRSTDGTFRMLAAQPSGVHVLVVGRNPDDNGGFVDVNYVGVRSLVWINAAGQLNSTRGVTPLTLSSGSVATNVFRPTLVPLDRGGLAISGGRAWFVQPEDSRFDAEPVAGSPGGTSVVADTPRVESCGSHVSIASSSAGGQSALYRPEPSSYGAGTLVPATVTILDCAAIEFGPPLKVNGQVITDGTVAGRKFISVGPTLTAVARPDGEILLIRPSENVTVPWSSSHQEASPLRTAGGTTKLGAGLTLDGPAGQRTFGGGAGKWLAARPDGRGGYYEATQHDPGTNAAPRFVVTLDGPDQTATQSCGGLAGYEPDPGFTTDARAAEAQRLVERMGDDVPGTRPHDCLTGKPMPEAPEIFGYDIGPDRGVIISRDAGTLQVTTWRSGAGGPAATVPLAAITGRPQAVRIDGHGTRVLVAMGTVLYDYGASDDGWTLNQTYSATVGQIQAASESPDGTLVLAATREGRFDIFESATGRRLASQTASITTGNDLFTRLALTESQGYTNAALDGPTVQTTVEIPTSGLRLRDLLCSVHRSAQC